MTSVTSLLSDASFSPSVQGGGSLGELGAFTAQTKSSRVSEGGQTLSAVAEQGDSRPFPCGRPETTPAPDHRAGSRARQVENSPWHSAQTLCPPGRREPGLGHWRTVWQPQGAGQGLPSSAAPPTQTQKLCSAQVGRRRGGVMARLSVVC